MKRKICLSVLSSVALLCCSQLSAFAADGPLHSPWDAPIAATQDAYRCNAVLHISPDISLDGASAHDAGYSESVSGLNALVKQVVRASQAYQTTGSIPAVQCALQQLQASAQDRTMVGRMDDKEIVKHEIEALRALSIAYLTLKPSGQVTFEQQYQIVRWMSAAFGNQRGYLEHSHCGPNGCAMQNHEYLEVVVSGCALSIAEQNRSFYDWSIGEYRTFVKRIDQHGMLHYDNIRQYALKFNTDSAAALVQLAEFGEANGEDMYDYDHGRIHMMVHTVTRGLLDPQPFVEAGDNADQVRPVPLQPNDVLWAAPYNDRFPDPVITQELNGAAVVRQQKTSSNVPWM